MAVHRRWHFIWWWERSIWRGIHSIWWGIHYLRAYELSLQQDPHDAINLTIVSIIKFHQKACRSCCLFNGIQDSLSPFPLGSTKTSQQATSSGDLVVHGLEQSLVLIPDDLTLADTSLGSGISASICCNQQQGNSPKGCIEKHHLWRATYASRVRVEVKVYLLARQLYFSTSQTRRRG